jgi:acetyl esterase/lipase
MSVSRPAIRLVAVALLGLAPSARAAEDPVVLNVWPGPAPGETTPIGEEKQQPSKPEERSQKKLTNISTPTIAVYRPAKDKDTGAAVLIAPGGGYNILAYDLEGEEVATWLNSIGVTGILLKYRVPRRPDRPKDQPPIGALQDAQRALSLVRSRASEWGIDPKRVGMLGFSAGGHLTAWAATNSDRRSYEPIDEADRQSCRPDFAVLIYPGGIQKKDAPDAMNPEIRVASDTPPCFFAHASDDPVSSENSVLMYLALKRAKVPADLHLYASGGHGFGLRPSDLPCSSWPQRCAEWLKAQGTLKAEGH